MWFLLSLALAQEPDTAPSAEPAQDAPAPALSADEAASGDISLFVRSDGAVYLNDELVNNKDLAGALGNLPTGSRLVIDADPETRHGRINEIAEMARKAGLDVAFAVQGSPVGPSSLFAQGRIKAEELPVLDASDLRQFAPKRSRLPQNPYANTDFTAYTLEWGETKVGIASITTGVLPRLQIGTMPVLDGLGVWNINAKANIVREGRVDGALIGQFYTVPVTALVNKATNLLGYDTFQPVNYTLINARYLGLGAMTSIQVLKPWSVHLGGYYAHVKASGEFDFGNLPSFLIPGLEEELGEVGGNAMLVPEISGDLVVMRFATDFRFNRRDSLIFQYQGALYARARAGTDFTVDGVPGAVDISLGYGGFIPLKYSYAASLAWQFSWKYVDLRVGWGVSYVPWAWVLQPLELSYRFGGHTRAQDGRVQRGYRQNRRDLRSSETPDR